MYDIKPLEEEWEKYRKKKRKPYVLMTGVFLLMVLTGAALYYTKGMDYFIHKEKNSTILPKKAEKREFVYVENRPLERLEVEKPVQAEVSENPVEIIEDLPLSADRPIRKKPRVKMNIVTTEIPTVKKRVQAEEKPHKRVHLTITETSTTSAYKEVAERFRETHDTDDSLFLARTYYNMGKYKKAEYWALQTNNIDSTIEESILIFAKAKAKRGHKNEAIRILSKYIKSSNSPEAKLLLKKIKKGKL